jgi:hypothetical protein
MKPSDPPKPFGPRLASKDDKIRAEAEAELAALGPAANDVLLTELKKSDNDQGSRVAILILTSQIFNIGNLLKQFAYGRLVLTICLPLFLFGLWLGFASFNRIRKQRWALCLLLSARNDACCISSLADLLPFRHVTLWNRLEMFGATELTRLIGLQRSDLANNGFNEAFFKILRAKVGPLYPLPTCLRPHPRAARTDLTDEQADLLATYVQVLALSETEEDRMLLLRIATHPAVTPNRQFVKEAAQAFTTPAPLPTALPYHTASTAAAPPPLTLRRP